PSPSRTTQSGTGASWSGSPPAAGPSLRISRGRPSFWPPPPRATSTARCSPSTAAGSPAEAWGWPRAGPLPPGRACAGPASTSLDRIGIEGVPDGIPHKVEGEHGGHDEEPRRQEPRVELEGLQALGVPEQEPPAGHGLFDPQAQEAHGRLPQDHPRQGQGGGDDEVRGDV